MRIEVAGPDDFPAAVWPALNVFGMTRLDAEGFEEFRYHYDDCHVIGVRDGNDWVATLGGYDFDLTVPGGGAVPANGVTIAGVLPTHRRRGILTALMERLLDDSAAAGQPVAILLASEASIYPRYGYGVAAQYLTETFDPRHVHFRDDVPDHGTFRLVADRSEATAMAEAVWDLYRPTRPGLTSRRPWTWENFRRDPEGERDGATPWNWVVHCDRSGEPDGYVVYRMKEEERAGLPAGSLRVAELIAPSADVEAALLRYLCGVDLIRTVELSKRPVDEPLQWRLTDQRQLVVTELSDYLWLRILDVPATMSARTYGTTDSFVLQVDDPFRPESGGTFRLVTSPAGASCERVDPTDGRPDLAMDTSALASLVLGTVAPTVLAAAGRIAAETAVLIRADACFRFGLAPFNLTDF